MRRTANKKQATLVFLRATLADMEAQLAELNRLMDAYRTVIAHIERADVSEVQPVGLSLRDAIWDVLNEAGEPLHYRKVYERLRQRGVDVPGLQPLKNVGAHMSLDDRFQSLGAGMWTVAA